MSRYCCHCLAEIDEAITTCPNCNLNQIEDVPVHHITIGTVLRDRYAVGKAIGEGGFGITYVGKDLLLNIKVAIKEFYPNGYVNRNNTVSMSVYGSTSEERRDVFEKGKDRFLNEARILAMFSKEPGIVDVKDFFETNNTAYIVMEYLEGKTLKQLLSQRGKFPPEEIWSMLTPVMLSLKEIHKHDLIHRDISPDNIMFVDGKLKLLDFGAARNVSAAANKSLSVMLKPGYAPEEQYRSKGKQGAWTDIYALCATIYKCITGITPDDSTERIIEDEVKIPSALGVAIPKEYEQALMKGLAVLQRDRFQTIDELITAVNAKTISEVDDSVRTILSPVTEDVDKTVYAADDMTLIGEADGSATVYAEESATVLGDVLALDAPSNVIVESNEDDLSSEKQKPADSVTENKSVAKQKKTSSKKEKSKGHLVSSYRRVIDMPKEKCENALEILMPDETTRFFEYCDEFSVSNQKKYVVASQIGENQEFLFFVFRNRYGKYTLISEGQDQKKVYRWFREKHAENYIFTDEVALTRNEKKKKHFAQDTAPRLFPSAEAIPQILTLPDKYECISSNAFAKLEPNGKEIRQIIISNSVEEIASNAFSGLVVTEAVCIPNSVKRIGENAFTLKEGAYIYCEGGSQAYKKYSNENIQVVIDVPFRTTASKLDGILAELSVSQKATRVKSGTIPFSLRSEVKCISIPNGICILDEDALYYAKATEKISIPTSVIRIGKNAFSLADNAYVECKQDSYAYAYCKEYGIRNSVDISNYYRSKGLCAHCGGRLSGFFKKKCSRCGQVKDY